MKVTTFRELMREQANAAVQVSGAHHSSWNGRYGAPIAESSKTGGTANWNHTISYNPRHVDEPLQDMFRNNRAHNQDKADLRRYRDALRIVGRGRAVRARPSRRLSGRGLRRSAEGLSGGTLIEPVPVLIECDHSSDEVLTRKALSHTFAALGVAGPG